MTLKRRRAVKSSTKDMRSLEISVAMLKQHQEYMTDRFVGLGDKFDRILSRVEELALHTTSLNSRHDTEIQVLQKQIGSTAHILNQTREDINDMTLKLTEILGKELAESVDKMSASIAILSEKMEKQNAQLDQRVQRLERWRMLLIGGGLAIGFLLSRAADNVLHAMFSFPK